MSLTPSERSERDEKIAEIEAIYRHYSLVYAAFQIRKEHYGFLVSELRSSLAREAEAKKESTTTTKLSPRPKVFADDDGSEWRCVAGQLEVREWDSDSGLDSSFHTSEHYTNIADWLEFLSRAYPASAKNAERALANQMTYEEASADDDAIGAPTLLPQETTKP